MSSGMHAPDGQHAVRLEGPVAAAGEALGKMERLESLIAQRGGLVVAFSGGVDSTLVAAAAMRAVGAYRGKPGRGALGVLADSTTLARRELHLARATADGLSLPLVEVEYSELTNPDWARNDADRCYHCKLDLSGEVHKVAAANGFSSSQVAYGTTVTDLGDHRPGLRAIAQTEGWQPLVEVGLSKDEVRGLAHRLGLPVWDKPATPCLASRVQYGERITERTLRMIEAAEDALRRMGFGVLRVRHHDALARIEVPVDRFDEVLGRKGEVVAVVKAAGYVYVTLDLVGHRSGAMNEVLQGPGHPGDRSGS